jgi:hypothetical protein
MARVERREVYAIAVDLSKPLSVEEFIFYKSELDKELTEADKATDEERLLDVKAHLANALWALAMLTSSSVFWGPSVPVIFPTYLELIDLPDVFEGVYVRSRSNGRRLG